jgi:hypothetical protein
MSNKNPFEIRAEILTLAKSYMDRQYDMNLALVNDMYEEGQKTYRDVQDAYAMYSTEELMAKAKEMYSFVSTKD